MALRLKNDGGIWEAGPVARGRAGSVAGVPVSHPWPGPMFETTAGDASDGRAASVGAWCRDWRRGCQRGLHRLTSRKKQRGSGAAWAEGGCEGASRHPRCHPAWRVGIGRGGRWWVVRIRPAYFGAAGSPAPSAEQPTAHTTTPHSSSAPSRHAYVVHQVPGRAALVPAPRPPWPPAPPSLHHSMLARHDALWCGAGLVFADTRRVSSPKLGRRHESSHGWVGVHVRVGVRPSTC